MNIIQKLLCRHKRSDVVCWHWTHGPNGNDILFLEIQKRCKDCGKIYFKNIENRDECDAFTAKYPEKQWSDKCKPI